MRSLSDAQKRVVESEDGAYLVVAGPGAGKTRVLTERVRRLIDAPGANYRVLALTFTNKAANEMKQRLKNDARVQQRTFIGTLHAFCMEVLANRGKPVGIVGLPHVVESYEDRKQMLVDAVESDSRLNFALFERGDKRNRDRALSGWLNTISEFKSNLIVPSMVPHDFDRQMYEAYDAQLRASSVLDFDDLLLLAYRLFEEQPAISRFYRRQYRYICIDEAQDLNEAQYRVLCALCRDEHRNVMLVGDPKQAIYTWNGADPKYLDMFVQDFAAETIQLVENFRSSRAVVRAAQVLDSGYEVAGQLPIEGAVTTRKCEDEKQEALFVVDTIQDLLASGHGDIEGGLTPEQFAVLGRNRFVFGEVEEELENRGLPYFKKVSMASHDFGSDLLRELELALRVVANPHDRLHLGMLVKTWELPTTVESLRGELREGRAADVLSEASKAARAGQAKVVAKALKVCGSESGRFDLPRALAAVEEETRSYSVEERETVARDIEEWKDAWGVFVRSQPAGGNSLASFLGHVALGTTEQASKEGIGLLTVHSSKGMEFDVVFLIAMAEGVFPDYRATSPGELAEERRNAFVACTRARRLLFVSYAEVRLMPWGDQRRVRPSVFFRDLTQSLR